MTFMNYIFTMFLNTNTKNSSPGKPLRTLQSPERAAKGFTLLELLMSMLIIMVLATIAIPAFNNYRRNARTARASSEVRVLETNINAYLYDRNSLPPLLSDVSQGNIRDPWGNLYVYSNTPVYEDVVAGKTLNNDYDIYSLGPNGITTRKIGDPDSDDDIIRASDGTIVSLSARF
jgi:general secretion pathway protein G